MVALKGLLVLFLISVRGEIPNFTSFDVCVMVLWGFVKCRLIEINLIYLEVVTWFGIVFDLT